MSVSLTSSPVTPAAPVAPRDRQRGWVWSALLLSGVAWLAVAWTALRLEPTEVALVAGGVLLFGAVTEVLRAMAGGQMWWLNAGMAALFTATGVVLMIDRDGSMTTPAALVGWYLLVRGAADIVTATLTRATDSAWGLMVAIGAAELGLGFYSSSSTGRTAGVVIVMVGALALGRGLADLATALGLRPATTPGETPAASARTAGYVAGVADFTASETARSGRARHRAAAGVSAARRSDAGVSAASAARQSDAGVSAVSAASQSDAERAAADLEAMLALAEVSGAAVASSLAYRASAPGRPGDTMSGGFHVAGDADSGWAWGAAIRTGGTAVGERRPALHSADGTVLARSATMFTGADALEAVDALPSDAYRVPAGPPVALTPTSFAAGPAEAMVQATQVCTVRISPAAAAGRAMGTGVVLECREPSNGAAARAEGTPIHHGSAAERGSVNVDPVNSRPVNEGPASDGAVNDGPVSQGPVCEGPKSQGPVNEGPANENRNMANQAAMNHGAVTQNTGNLGNGNQGTGNQGPVNRGNGNPRGGNTGNGNHAGMSEPAPGTTAVRSERLLGRGPSRRRAV